MNNSSCCINDILKVINILQNQAEKIDDIDLANAKKVDNKE